MDDRQHVSYKEINKSTVRKRFEQIKRASELALKHRRAIQGGDFSVFLPALAFAIAKDTVFDFIPVLGEVFGIFVTVYLLIFLWGKGKWKVRIVIFILSCFEAIPFVNIIPFQTVCVLYAYHQAKKDAKQAQEQLSTLGGAV